MASLRARLARLEREAAARQRQLEHYEAKTVVRHHHERWDGSGYPDGLSGDAIPLSARVFALADALDALTTDRPYRPAIPFAAARAVIRAEAGLHFDPAMVAAYDSVPDAAFVRIRDGLA